MPQMPHNFLAVAPGILAPSVLFTTFSPLPLREIARSLLALWSFGLLAASLATLLWFFYRFFLRRIMRARRIANLRLKRMMEERNDDGPNVC